MSLTGGVIDFGQALLMPALQAAATLTILSHQKKQYDEVAAQRIDLLNAAVEKYVQSTNALVNSGQFRTAFGSVPDAILYQPVSIDQEQLDSINENLRSLPDADRLITAANRIMEQNDIARAIALDPRYLHNVDAVSVQIRDLLAGKLPVDDAVEVLTNTAEQAALRGRIGNVKGITGRNLGISRLRMQAAGRAEFKAHQRMLNQDVSPISRQRSITEYLQTPAQRVSLALTQNQLIQQSLQNAANADAAGDPTVYAELQTELQKINNVLGNEAQRGNLVNQFTPNYAAILQPQINALTESLQWGDPDAAAPPNPTTTQSASNPESATTGRSAKDAIQ